jgi:lipoprotein NlpD
VLRFFLLIYILLKITACSSTQITYAPVTDITTIEPIPKSGVHQIKTHETVYSVAWRYGLDYRDVAKRNHLQQPYRINQGQNIYLTQPVSKTSTPKKRVIIAKTPPIKKTPQKMEQEPTARVNQWQWPANGPLIAGYSNTNKGINIGGQSGDPVFASASGKVVYCGNGLRGYGNLIIIKHNSAFLTAYAHNKKVFVKEGQWVKSGQQIASIGNTGTKRTMLHFEIRRNGNPVNPLVFLTKRGA